MAYLIQTYSNIENDKKALDKIANTVDDLLYSTDNSAPQFFLFDIRTLDMERLRHLVLHLKELRQAYNDNNCIFFALVLGEKVLPDVADAILKTMIERCCVQTFSSCGTATQWLLIEQTKIERKLARS